MNVAYIKKKKKSSGIPNLKNASTVIAKFLFHTPTLYMYEQVVKCIIFFCRSPKE